MRKLPSIKTMEKRDAEYRETLTNLKSLFRERELFYLNSKEDPAYVQEKRMGIAVQIEKIAQLLSAHEAEIEGRAEMFLRFLQSKNYMHILSLPYMPPELVVKILSLSTSKTLEKAKEIEKEKASAKGSEMAKKKSEKSGIPKLKNKIQEIWASGHYTNRDLCAEQEWAALGFGSISTARKALRNTPEPPSRC